MKTIITTTAVMLASAGIAFAGPAIPGDYASPPVAQPPIVEVVAAKSPFEGFYLGATTKYAFAPSEVTYAIGKHREMTLPVDLSGMAYGIYGGYGFVAPSGLYLGAEVNAQWYTGADTVNIKNCDHDFTGSIDSTVSVRARIGLQTGKILPYAFAGYAWGTGTAEMQNNYSNAAQTVATSFEGMTYGAGLEVALGNRMTIGVEYAVYDFGPSQFVAAGVNNSVTNNLETVSLRLGVSF